MTMSDDEIRRWYQKHGMEYIPADWDDELPQRQGSEQHGREKHKTVSLPWFAFEDEETVVDPIWRERTNEERAEVEAIEEFFDPYLVRLPKRQEDLIRDVTGNRRTFQDIAEERHTSRQAVHQAFKRAVQALVREVEKDGLDLETALNDYWQRRFGVRYPGLVQD